MGEILSLFQFLFGEVDGKKNSFRDVDHNSISKAQTRTSKVGAISNAQKAQSILFEKTNIHSVEKLQLSKKLKGRPFGGKQILKKVSQCRKTERGTLGGFSTSILSQNMKKIEEKIFFRKKSHNAKKTVRGDPLGFFNIHKLSRSAEKKLKGGTLWCCPVWYVTRKNREIFFGLVR